MNHFSRNHFSRVVARWLCVLLAVLALPVGAPAQPAPARPQRWLLVFDLSSVMKKRLPATEEVLKNFFDTAAGGRLQEGDYIGVWTYDQKLHAGQFPLITWNPRQATADRTNLAAFLRSRRFTGESSLAALQPALNQVIGSSERLTTVIFCDGESEISATPYDSGVNQSFQDNREERKTSRQPFVVLIRTLSGKYIGCTVNFPPGPVNIPLFLAPVPHTNPPPAAVHIKPPSPPPVVVPDLILVGTNKGATTSPAPPKNLPPEEKPVLVATHKIAAAPATNPAPATAAAKMVLPASNAPAKETPGNEMVAAVPAATNPVAAPTPEKTEAPVAVPAANTATVPTTPVAAETDRTALLIFAGIGLLAAAIVLAVLLLARRTRRPQSSLITTSMQDGSRKK
jgi:hypothetical protein